MEKIRQLGVKIEYLEKRDMLIAVDSLGAKVLVFKAKGKDILYYDKNDIKHSGIPICFPFFGPLRDNVLTLKGKRYEMGRHGFFRDMEFELLNNGEEICCKLQSNGETMKKYPYEFEFDLVFSLGDSELLIDVRLLNKSGEGMAVAPGFHPYFSVENPKEVYIETKAAYGEDSLNARKKTQLAHSDVFDIASVSGDVNRLKIKKAPDIQLLNHELNETAIFPGGGTRVALRADMELFNRMTIWRDKETASYICVEPSFVENAVNTDQAILIDPKKEFRTRLSVKASVDD